MRLPASDVLLRERAGEGARDLDDAVRDALHAPGARLLDRVGVAGEQLLGLDVQLDRVRLRGRQRRRQRREADEGLGAAVGLPAPKRPRVLADAYRKWGILSK